MRATRRRASLSRLLNGKAGVSANMALGDIGWGAAEHWTRMQASYELAQARSAREKSRTIDELQRCSSASRLWRGKRR